MNRRELQNQSQQVEEVLDEFAQAGDEVALERAERLAAERGGKAFTSLTDALQAVDIDVVSVCTPTGRHGEVAIEALEAGKHVIIEKPAETTVAKTDEIIAAQRRADDARVGARPPRRLPGPASRAAGLQRGFRPQLALHRRV